MMENIKLVIWDLDDTFWKGTLSEGNVEIIDRNVEIVKELSKRGIMSSISSNNNFEDAKNILQRIGIWYYFIFPSINWNPKGESVSRIIDACQLRTPNVLFIDDNISNRKEVEHYNNGINTISEVYISGLLSMPELQGKNDKDLSRLKQYKILEEKARVKETYSDNHAFLIESDIRINFIEDVRPYRDRVLELINRTNQLNYTKIRLNNENVDALLKQPGKKNVCIHVADKFGDYGICGFYSLDILNNHLDHFLFSCRILNLGIESYVYKKLGKPTIDVVKPVAYGLDINNTIDWVREDFDKNDIVKNRSENKTKVLLLGGCDLEQMCHYLDEEKFDIIKEFNYPNSKGYDIHREHTKLLRVAATCNTEEIKAIGDIPFYDQHMFETSLFNGDYDVLVYSLLMNYTQEILKHRDGKWCLAYGGYTSSMNQLLAGVDFSEDEKSKFITEYMFIGQQAADDFVRDLEWLTNVVNNKKIIFINGSEIDDFNELELGACQRHKIMNKALEDFVRHHPNCCILDMRKIVTSRLDCKDNIRHYQRPVYRKMAGEIMSLITGRKTGVGKFKIFEDLVIRPVANAVYRILNFV